MERFSERLQELRKEKNATKEDLAAIWELLCGPIAIMKRGSAILIFKG